MSLAPPCSLASLLDMSSFCTQTSPFLFSHQAAGGGGGVRPHPKMKGNLISVIPDGETTLPLSRWRQHRGKEDYQVDGLKSPLTSCPLG